MEGLGRVGSECGGIGEGGVGVKGLGSVNTGSTTQYTCTPVPQNMYCGST